MLHGFLGPFPGYLFIMGVACCLSEPLNLSELLAEKLLVFMWPLFSSSGTLWYLSTPRTPPLAPPTHHVVLLPLRGRWFAVDALVRSTVGKFTTTCCTVPEDCVPSGLWDSAMAWSLRPSTPCAVVVRGKTSSTTVWLLIPVSLCLLLHCRAGVPTHSPEFCYA